MEQELKLRIEDLEAELDDLKHQHGLNYYSLFNSAACNNGINSHFFNRNTSERELLDKVIKKKKIIGDVEVVEINDLNDDNKTDTMNDNASNNFTNNNTYNNTINTMATNMYNNCASNYINVNTSVNDKEFKTINKTDKKKGQTSSQKNRNSYKMLQKENDKLKALLATYEIRDKQNEIEEKKLKLKEMLKNEKSYYSYKKSYPSKKFTIQNNLHKKLENDYLNTETNVKDKKRFRKINPEGNSQTIKSEKLRKEDSNYKSNKVIPVLKINELNGYNTEINEKNSIKKKESIRKVLHGNSSSLVNSSLSVNKSFGKKVKTKSKLDHKDLNSEYKTNKNGVISHKRIRTNPIISLSKKSTNRIQFKPKAMDDQKEKSFQRESVTYRFKSKSKNQKVNNSFNNSLNDKITVTERSNMKLNRINDIKIDKIIKTEGCEEIYHKKNIIKNNDRSSVKTGISEGEEKKKQIFYKINVAYKKDKEKEIKHKDIFSSYNTSNNTASINMKSQINNSTYKKEKKFAKPSLKKHGKQNSVIINNYNSYNYFNLYSGINKSDKKQHEKLKSFTNKEISTIKPGQNRSVANNINNLQSTTTTISQQANSFYKLNIA